MEAKHETVSPAAFQHPSSSCPSRRWHAIISKPIFAEKSGRTQPFFSLLLHTVAPLSPEAECLAMENLFRNKGKPARVARQENWKLFLTLPFFKTRGTISPERVCQSRRNRRIASIRHRQRPADRPMWQSEWQCIGPFTCEQKRPILTGLIESSDLLLLPTSASAEPEKMIEQDRTDRGRTDPIQREAANL